MQTSRQISAPLAQLPQQLGHVEHPRPHEGEALLAPHLPAQKKVTRHISLAGGGEGEPTHREGPATTQSTPTDGRGRLWGNVQLQ